MERDGARGKNLLGATGFFQFADNASVDGLRLGRDIPGDKLFALGVNVTQQPSVLFRVRIPPGSATS
jgi:hypothetical protein